MCDAEALVTLERIIIIKTLWYWYITTSTLGTLECMQHEIRKPKAKVTQVQMHLKLSTYEILTKELNFFNSVLNTLETDVNNYLIILPCRVLWDNEPEVFSKLLKRGNTFFYTSYQCLFSRSHCHTHVMSNIQNTSLHVLHRKIWKAKFEQSMIVIILYMLYYLTRLPNFFSKNSQGGKNPTFPSLIMIGAIDCIIVTVFVHISTLKGPGNQF